jgi:threonine dehydratase
MMRVEPQQQHKSTRIAQGWMIVFKVSNPFFRFLQEYKDRSLLAQTPEAMAAFGFITMKGVRRGQTSAAAAAAA